MPCFNAISLAAYLNRKAWSATTSGSSCSRLISNCVRPTSWIQVSARMPSVCSVARNSSQNAACSLSVSRLNADWPHLGAAAAHRGRAQRLRRVVAGRGQVELDLGRDDRAQAAALVARHHVAQDRARRELAQLAGELAAVVDGQRARHAGPGHGLDRGVVGHQQHVRILVGKDRVVRVVARHALHRDRLRDAQLGAARERGRRHQLAARVAGDVGEHAFDVRDAPGREIGRQVGGWGVAHAAIRSGPTGCRLQRAQHEPDKLRVPTRLRWSAMPLTRPPFDTIALVLQGGGALGAYQAGVMEGLSDRRHRARLGGRHLDRRDQRGADRRQRAGEIASRGCASSGTRCRGRPSGPTRCRSWTRSSSRWTTGGARSGTAGTPGARSPRASAASSRRVPSTALLGPQPPDAAPASTTPRR